MADTQKPKTKEQLLNEAKALLKYAKEHPEELKKIEALVKNQPQSGVPADSQKIQSEGARANNPNATPGSAGADPMKKVGPSEGQSTPAVPAESQTIKPEGAKATNPNPTAGSAGADPMGKMAKREMIKKELSSEFKPKFKKCY